MVAYTTADMDDATAYELTKTYWDERSKMAETAAWWNGVNAGLMKNITGKIHPGALKYYEEAGFPITDEQR